MKPQEKLMLVRLSATEWRPRKQDKKAAAALAKASNAQGEIGTFYKQLVESTAIKPLQQAVRELRSLHYAMTAPWDDAGLRVLPSKLYFDYIQQVNEARELINEYADNFCFAVYEPQREAAQERLGALFNPADYPPAQRIRDKFQVEVSFTPLPNPGDVEHWALEEDDRNELAEAIRQEVEESVEAAHRAVIQDVIKVCREMGDKITAYANKVDRDDGKAMLYETALTNVTDLAERIIVGLNITEDAQLEEEMKNLKGALEGISVERLRGNWRTRGRAIRTGYAMAAKLEGIYG